MYNVDWDALLLQSLKPTCLNDVDISFMRAMWQPFARINATVNAKVDENKIILRYNASKIMLERYLNEYYDLLAASNKIYITNNSPRELATFFQNIEARPGYMMYPTWSDQEPYVINNRVFRNGFIYRSKTSNSNKTPENNTADWENEGAMTSFYQLYEVGQSSVQFTVYVPSALTFNAEEMKALLFRYLPPFKTFNIQTY